MRKPKTIVFTVLFAVSATISGCGTKPASNQNTDTKVAVETKAKTNVEAQRAKEKAYNDAVKSGTNRLLWPFLL